MEWLNYHHLFYFWNVAKEGTVSAAAKKLHVARTTVTAQVRELEKAADAKLFRKSGRYLELTEFGQHVYRYAEEIFAIGRELKDFMKTGQPGMTKKFVVGMPDVVPKLVAFELLKPAIHHPERFQIVCHEGKLPELMADLALHRLDLIISDSPAPATVDVRAYSHRLGECGLSFLAVPELARKHRRKFPWSLNGAPVCLPTDHTAVRRSLNHWLDENDIHPQVIAEFEDSALLKVFGQSGLGIVPVPTAIEKEVKTQYGMQLVGRLDDVIDRFYAISVEKRVHHPAVVAIVKQARSKIFEKTDS
jgi:LysR family transcriptional activator of nhaA